MIINGTDGWESFKEHRPRLGQAIAVHTYSNLTMKAVYTPTLNLEDFCDAWRPWSSRFETDGNGRGY